MTFPVKKLLSWYGKNKRDLPWRNSKDIYAVWVSEIMLQQTQVTTVIPYYRRFMERFPTVAVLAGADEQEVLKLWEGLGYYSRARNLHRAAKTVVDSYKGKVPGNPKEFPKLPGVGRYVAAAVLSITCHEPLPAVDGNVLRVYSRFQSLPQDISKTSTRNMVYKELQAIIPPLSPGNFNQAVMELGALICIPKNPHCSACPLNKDCRSYINGTVANFPVKSSPLKVPEYNVSIAVIIEKGKLFIQKRPSKGHLGGLWEFPGGKAEPGESPEAALVRECKEELHTDIQIKKKLALVHHAYTHFKIHMSVFICSLKRNRAPLDANSESLWISIDQLKKFPFPKANHKFFPLLKDYFNSTP